MNEEWKDVPGYEGLYKVSNFGNVYSYYSKKILKPAIADTGYYKVILCKEGKHTNMKIHCLVCSAFLGERPKGAEIDHIDRNRLNNNLNNLRYVSKSENQRNKEEYNLGRRKAVLQFDLRGNLVNEYASLHDAARDCGVGYQNIWHVCNGNRKTAGGYMWQYK